MSRNLIYGLWGFTFGTVGLYLLAFLALSTSFFETITAPLMWPGRAVSETFVGVQGGTMAVVLLTLLNGILYALLFIAVAWSLRQVKGNR